MKRILIIATFKLFTFSLIGQEFRIMDFFETNEIENAFHPLYDYQNKIIGKVERKVESLDVKNYEPKKSYKSLIKIDSGLEVEIDGLFNKIVFVKKSNTIIATWRLPEGYVGCTIYIPSDIYVYDTLGSLLTKVQLFNTESFSRPKIEISSKGDVYDISYWANEKTLVLSKIDSNGVVWKNKLPTSIPHYKGKTALAISPNEEKIAVKQSINQPGENFEILSVFNSKGDLINQIEGQAVWNLISFWGNDQIFCYSNSSPSIKVIDLNKQFIKQKKLNSFSLGEFFGNDYDRFSYFIHPNKKYFGVYENTNGELSFYKITGNKPNLIQKNSLDKKHFRRIVSQICLEDRIEFYNGKEINTIKLEQ